MNKENCSEKKYSNYVSVTATPMEVFLSFKLLSPETPTLERAEDVITVALPPSVAISLMNIMRDSIRKQVEMLEKDIKLKKRQKK